MKSLQDAMRPILSHPTPEALVVLQGALLAHGQEDPTVEDALEIAGHFYAYLCDLKSKTTTKNYSELASRLDIGAVGAVALENVLTAQGEHFLQGLFVAAVGKDSVFAGGSRHGTNFLKLLLENGRVVALPEISEQFEALKAKVENSIDAVITAASPVSEAQQKAIASSLSAKLGRDVRISTQIDENLIGGAVIRAGDVVIDGSLRARLEGLANALTK
jgi:ATP synthase F1 delta subunit